MCNMYNSLCVININYMRSLVYCLFFVLCFELFGISIVLLGHTVK